MNITTTAPIVPLWNTLGMPKNNTSPSAENASEAELLAAMEAAPNKRSYRRFAAIRALLKGFEAAAVAAFLGVPSECCDCG
jgi:hypothetical protein